MKKIAMAIAATTLLNSSLVLAQTSKTPDSAILDKNKSLVENFFDFRQLKVVEQKKMNDTFMAHLIENKQGMKEVVFTDVSGRYVLAGQGMRIIDLGLQGAPITELVRDEMNPPVTVEDLKDEIEATGIAINTQDSSKPTLYLVSETLCPYCAKTHKLLKDIGAEGDKDVNIQILPVAFPSHVGADQHWAYVMKSEDKIQAVNEVFDALLKRDRAKLNSLKADVTPEMKKSLEKMAIVATKLKAQSTPMLFYKGSDGKMKTIIGANDQKIKEAYKQLKSATKG